jgi:hypothetical protein
VVSEPITVTDSDAQSLEKKLVQFAETLPDAEQLYLAAMLARGIEHPDGVSGFMLYDSTESTTSGVQKKESGTDQTRPPPTPKQILERWVRKWTG